MTNQPKRTPQSYHREAYKSREKRQAAKQIEELQMIRALRDGIEMMEYIETVLPDGMVKQAVNDWMVVARHAIAKAYGRDGE